MFGRDAQLFPAFYPIPGEPIPHFGFVADCGGRYDMSNGFPSLLRSGLSHNNRGQDGVDHRIHLLMISFGKFHGHCTLR